MRTWFSELTNPIVYIREVESPKRQVITFKKREPLTEKELLEKIINTSYNKKWPDGRIYGMSKDGKYVSHSVTPYANSFLDNIEEKIKPLIIALKDKNYLSMSSCQGHCLWDRRFVMLVFPSKETAEDFTKQFPFKLKFNIKHCTEMLNVKLDIDQYGTIKNASKEALVNNSRQSIKYVNAFCKRSYTDAWFVEMILADVIPYNKYIRYFKQIIFKKFFLERFTAKVTKFIESKLKPNIY
jgi:hypothetical protein